MLCCVRYAGILSAYGMALADVVHEAQEPCAVVYSRGMFTVQCTSQMVTDFPPVSFFLLI